MFKNLFVPIPVTSNVRALLSHPLYQGGINRDSTNT